MTIDCSAADDKFTILFYISLRQLCDTCPELISIIMTIIKLQDRVAADGLRLPGGGRNEFKFLIGSVVVCER